MTTGIEIALISYLILEILLIRSANVRIDSEISYLNLKIASNSQAIHTMELMLNS
jgi:hypothetical protein